MSAAPASLPPGDNHKPGSGSIRRSELARTLARVAPAPTIDQTRVMTDEELEEQRRETEQRIADRQTAEETGRSALHKRLAAAVERATGTTPPDGTRIPADLDLEEPAESS